MGLSVTSSPTINRCSAVAYGVLQVRASLLNEFDMVVNRKLIRSMMREPGLAGLPKPKQRRPDLAAFQSASAATLRCCWR